MLVDEIVWGLITEQRLTETDAKSSLGSQESLNLPDACPRDLYAMPNMRPSCTSAESSHLEGRGIRLRAGESLSSLRPVVGGGVLLAGYDGCLVIRSLLLPEMRESRLCCNHRLQRFWRSVVNSWLRTLGKCRSWDMPVLT